MPGTLFRAIIAHDFATFNYYFFALKLLCAKFTIFLSPFIKCDILESIKAL